MSRCTENLSKDMMKPVVSRSGKRLGIQRAGLGFVGLACVSLTVSLTGCVPSQQAQAPIDGIASGNRDAENALKNPTAQDFSKPIIAQVDLSQMGSPKGSDRKTPPLATVPVKGLTQATRSEDRAQQATINTTRDPFAALQPKDISLPGLTQFTSPKDRKSATVPVLSKQSLKPSLKSAQPSRMPNAQAQRPQPIRPRTALPTAPLNNLPTIPVQNNLPPIGNPTPIAPPPIDLPIAPPISPTHLADQVEITGVVQVGNRIMAIAKAPEETSARYVNTGDLLSSGRVIVREIRVGTSGQPTVILEQNGQKVVKSIGVSRMASIRF
jgi:hypothetical protein